MNRRSVALTLPFVTLVVTGIVAAQQSGSTIETPRIFESLGLKEGMTVCEMGAGDGELTLAAAKVVGTSGRVYTSELGDDRVKTLRGKVSASGLPQVSVVAGDPVKTNFPAEGCDALFMRNVYHHFTDPPLINASIKESLKAGGRLSVVDFTPPGKEAARPEDRSKDGMHGVTGDTVAAELKSAGLDVVNAESAPQRWFMVTAVKPSR